MKNSEKFKTAKARERAFEKFCIDVQKNNGYCFNCPAARNARKKKIMRCSFAWLDMEAEENKNELINNPYKLSKQTEEQDEKQG